MHDEDEWRGSYERDGREIFFRVVRHFREHAGRDGISNRHRQQRVAVGRRLDCDLGAYHAAGSRTVVDDDLLAEGGRQFLRDCARDHVGRSAGGERHHHRDLLGRKGLGVSGRSEAETDRSDSGQGDPADVAEPVCTVIHSMAF